MNSLEKSCVPFLAFFLAFGTIPKRRTPRRRDSLTWCGLLLAAVIFGQFGPLKAHAAPILIGHWELDGNANDSGGNGLNGSIIGGPSPTSDRFGNTNSALSFSGNGYVRIPDAAPMQVASHSISLWFTWDRLGTDIVDFLTAKAGENFEIHTGGGGGIDGIRYIPSNSHYNDNPGIIHSDWNHLVTTFDNTTDTSRVYLDGVLAGTLTQSTGGNVLGDFFIGARGNGSFQYFGDIDDVRLYDGVLTQDDIDALFSGATAAAVPEPASLAIWSLISLVAAGYTWPRTRKGSTFRESVRRQRLGL